MHGSIHKNPLYSHRMPHFDMTISLAQVTTPELKLLLYTDHKGQMLKIKSYHFTFDLGLTRQWTGKLQRFTRTRSSESVGRFPHTHQRDLRLLKKYFCTNRYHLFITTLNICTSNRISRFLYGSLDPITCA